MIQFRFKMPIPACQILMMSFVFIHSLSLLQTSTRRLQMLFVEKMRSSICIVISSSLWWRHSILPSWTLNAVEVAFNAFYVSSLQTWILSLYNHNPFMWFYSHCCREFMCQILQTPIPGEFWRTYLWFQWQWLYWDWDKYWGISEWEDYKKVCKEKDLWE